MTPLFLLRHGPTEASRDGAPLGRLDLPVLPKGELQWPKVKGRLLRLGIERVLTSDLQRARRHAEDLGLPVRVLPDLGEQAFGEWEGLPWGQIPGAEAYLANPVQGTPRGGESFAHCASRTLQALQGALEPECPTLVLAHGGPLRAILAHYLGLPLERALDLAWKPYGLTRLEVYGHNRAVLRFHNQSG